MVDADKERTEKLARALEKALRLPHKYLKFELFVQPILVAAKQQREQLDRLVEKYKLKREKKPR